MGKCRDLHEPIIIKMNDGTDYHYCISCEMFLVFENKKLVVSKKELSYRGFKGLLFIKTGLKNMDIFLYKKNKSLVL